MNNLPKVVTQRRLEQDLNSRPVDRKPKRLTRCTTAPPTIIYPKLPKLTETTKRKFDLRNLPNLEIFSGPIYTHLHR